MYCAKRIQLHKALVLLLSFILISTTVLGGTFAQIVAKTPTFINTFLSGLDPTGDLIISKEVTHPFGEGYLIPDGMSFSFTVSLGSKYAGKTVETSQGALTADESGSITVTVAPDGAVRIKNILNGTAVTVTEAAAVGFTPNGGAQKSVTIKAGENHLAYTNVYAPRPVQPVNLTVSGTKLLEGRDWQAGDCFTFQLEYRLAGDDTWNKLGETSVSYDPNNAEFNHFSFTELVQGIPYDTAGVYSFRVSEVEGTVPGITYDQVVSYFDVTVGDADMDGALELRAVEGYQNATASYDGSTGSFHVAVAVNNKYAPAGTATARILIDKQVMSLSGEEKSAAGYTFELYDESGSLVATSGKTSAAGETAIELTYEATAAGETFYYTLKETHGGETHNGLIYDGTVYPLSVSITDELDGTISAYVYSAAQQQTALTEVNPEEAKTAEASEESTAAPENSMVTAEKLPVAEIPDNATRTYTVSFVNVYDPADTSASFGGTKDLVGRTLRDGEFVFELYAAGENFTVAAEQQPIQSTSNHAGGAFAFHAIEYSKVGVYRYVVKESASAQLGGITYDTAVFHVIVTVTDENGVLTADVSVTDELGAAAQIKFCNSYKAAPVSVTLSGTKTLTGMDLTAQMFRFQLDQTDENYAVLGAEPESALNDAAGSFAFSSIQYSQPGTFYYTVTEDTSEGVEGMTYDETVYGVKVSVWDDYSGFLQADVTVCVVGGEETEEIRFENSYRRPEAPLTGDNIPLAMYFALALSSAAAIVAFFASNKKKGSYIHK